MYKNQGKKIGNEKSHKLQRILNNEWVLNRRSMQGVGERIKGKKYVL